MNDMIQCYRCDGFGREGYEVIGIIYFGALRALPHFKTCPSCKGLGEVYEHDPEMPQEGYKWDMETGEQIKL
jgi:DnaJ-class molecular chaperone